MGRTLSCCAAALLASPWACGPSPDVELDEESAISSGAQGSSTGAPGPAPPTEEMNSTGSVATRGDSDDLDTSDGEDEDSDDDDGYTCGCEETIPVSFDRVVDGEFSAATVIAVVASTEIPWQWTAFVDAPPETVMSVDLSYEGGQVLHGPEGDDGCAFLSSPCSNALVIPVVATLTTADNVLVASLSGTLDVDLDRWTPQEVTFVGQLVAGELGGTLGDQLLADSGAELISISVYLDWELDGTSREIYLSGTTTDAEMTLGEHVR